MALRIGAKLPNSGPLAADRDLAARARALEEAGFDSLWVSDHIIMPREIRSRYPFASDGKATWPPTTPWLDALVALAAAAAVTERVALGTAVLVLPLRHPIIAAKQLASIDVVSGGRLRLGVGAGWLREEFDALAVSFADRASRLEEWLDLLRACWKGDIPAVSGRHYTLPQGFVSFPTPTHPIPVLVGGHTRSALQRAGRLGDGWLGQQSAGALDPAEIEAARKVMLAAAPVGAPERTVVLRIVESAGRSDDVARSLGALAAAGVEEVIVDVDWSDGDPRRELERLRAGAP